MTLDEIITKYKAFLVDLNQKGIPLPTARDPKTKVGSVSLSMVVTSYSMTSLCIGMTLGLIVSKWAGFYTDAGEALSALEKAFDMSFQMSVLSSGLYWGRKFQKDSDGQVQLAGDKHEGSN